MAVRLPVIMIHSPPGGSRWQSLGESVIGELIGRPGIDLTLVGRLADLATGSTDRLTLESLRGDLVVLDWQPPDGILADWHRLGLDGARAPHRDDQDPAPVSPPTRRIYAFDLRGFDDAAPVCDAVKRLLESRQTRTFTLGGIGNGKPTTAPPPSNPTSGSTRFESVESVESVPSPADPTRNRTDGSPISHRDESIPGSTSPPDRDRELDALVDELDLLDP